MQPVPVSPFSQRLFEVSEWLWSTKRRVGWLAAGLGALILFTAFVVYLTPSMYQPVLAQTLLVPIVLAAMTFGVLSGAAAGFVASVLLGPWIPFAPYGWAGFESWVFQLVLFVGLGAVIGLTGQSLLRRARASEALSAELAEAYGRNLRTLANLIEARDELTSEHCERVAYNAYVMGKALGLRGTDLEHLYWAALLHDLGKIAIPESILNKPGPLSQDERQTMERHVEIGSKILLSASSKFAPVAEIIHAHHERMDGKGYPRGLAGQQIPIGSRVVAVLDVFEALTARRAYRGAIPREQVLQIISNSAGTHFDPKVVEVFQRLLKAKKLVVGGESDEAVLEDLLSTNANQRITLVP